jgi:hypothetical protein
MKPAGQATAESKILQSRSPLEWTGPEAGSMLACMGQPPQIGRCPRCGCAMKPALPTAGAGCGLQCTACAKYDPLKSELVTGWLSGELGRPKLTVIEPK